MTAPPRDQHQAKAFRDLEAQVSDLHDLTLLMDLAAEDTIYKAEGEVVRMIRERQGLKGYHLVLLTDEQRRALDFVMHKVGDAARVLERAYYAGLEGNPPCA